MSLGGRTVLVPRGGAWGLDVAGRILERGGTPWVVPLIEARAVESAALRGALEELAAGGYDWLAVTSAAAADVLAVADVLAAHGAPSHAYIPATTRVVAVGPATARALERIGVTVDLVPERDHSAAGLLEVWQAHGRVLVLHSDLAGTTLADGLRERGCEVDAEVAYRTGAVPVSAADVLAVADGAADVILVTSGSVARQVRRLDVPARTLIACLGPVTARDAQGCGLRVDVVAPQNTVEALLGAVEENP